VMLGWMSNWQYAAKTPTNPWRGQMTVPRRLLLRKMPEGLRLVQEPVDAIQALRGAHFTWSGQNAAELNRALAQKAAWSSYELRSAVEGAGAEVSWRLAAGEGKYTTVGYSAGQLFVDRTHSGVSDFSQDFPARITAPLALGQNPLELTILVDRSTLEVFAQSGKLAMSDLIYPPAGAHGIQFSAADKAARVTVDVWELKTAWK